MPSEFWPKVNILFMHFGNLQIITVGNWIWFSTQDFQELSLLCMRWRWTGRRWTFFCLKWLFLPQMTWCMQTLLNEGHFTKSVRLHHHSESLDWQTTKFGALLPFYFFLLVWRVERQRICDRLSHKSLWGPRYIRRPQKTATK